MTILIEELEFETILGILEYERITPQKIRIDCSLEYAYMGDTFLNYAEVTDRIKSVMHEERFELIEEALQSLAYSLRKTFPSITTLSLTIRKPDILTDCTVGVRETFHF